MLNIISHTKSGAYVPVSGGGLEVDMDGDFVSLHALRTGEWDFTLPFPCRVVNAKTGQDEQVSGGRVHLSLTAGETCWFRLKGNPGRGGVCALRVRAEQSR